MNELNIISLSFLVFFLSTSIYFYFKNSKLIKELIPLKKMENENYTQNENQKIKLSLKKKNKDIENNYISQISDLKINHVNELSELKDDFNKKRNEIYKKGFDDGKKSVDFEIRITPIKKITKDEGFFSSTKKMKIGYSHRLYVNGIPCLDQNDVFVEEIIDKQINEENINRIVSLIATIVETIPNEKLKMKKNTLDGFEKDLKSEIPK